MLNLSFENIEENKNMLNDAYRKLKSCIYYKSEYALYKLKLAEWETSDKFNESIEYMAIFLQTGSTQTLNNDYLMELMNEIDVFIMPKKFNNIKEENNFVSNEVKETNELKSVHYFIDLPVELMILDTLWTIIISACLYDKKIFNNHIYANRIWNKKLYKEVDGKISINFKNNILFEYYSYGYKQWKYDYLKQAKKYYNNNNDCIIIKMDICNYFYTVKLKFDKLNDKIDENDFNKCKHLTKFIEDIYKRYTTLLKKFRNDIEADPGSDECILPIGLTSSMVLSNLYLRDLDSTIENKLDCNIYRYVDDIIIVKKINKDEVEKYNSYEKVTDQLEDNNIIKNFNGKPYFFSYPELKFNPDKFKCIYLYAKNENAFIDLLKWTEQIKPSMERCDFIVGNEFIKENFYEQLYVRNEYEDIIAGKWNNNINRSNLTIFLKKMIKISCNINKNDKKYMDFTEKQLNQILKFFKEDNIIKHYKYWQPIFTIILLNFYNNGINNDETKKLKEFIESINNAISKVEFSPCNSNIYNENLIQGIQDLLRITLKNYCFATFSISIAPFGKTIINKTSEVFSNIFTKEKFKCRSLWEESNKIRTVNLYDNSIVVYPLLGYMEDLSDDTNLLNSNDLNEMFAKNNIKFDFRYAPRFIPIGELIYNEFLIKQQNVNSIYKQLSNPVASNIITLYKDINGIVDDDLGFEIEEHENQYLNNFNVRVNRKNTNNKVKVAICSKYLDLSDADINNYKKGINKFNTFNNYCELFELLKRAVIEKVNVVVFPEFYLPIEWLLDVTTFAKNNRLTIISGLSYVKGIDNNGNTSLNNYLINIQFCEIIDYSNKIYTKNKTALPLIREKNDYAPLEKNLLHKQNDINSPILFIVNDGVYSYSTLMCFELTNINYRAFLRGKVEALYIPEYNKDTNYFSNIVESTVRDLHCFVVQANTSKYGDCRITAPYNTIFKDIVKIKGGETMNMIVGTLDVEGLNTVRLKNDTIENIIDQKKVKLNTKFKDIPARF